MGDNGSYIDSIAADVVGKFVALGRRVNQEIPDYETDNNRQQVINDGLAKYLEDETGKDGWEGRKIHLDEEESEVGVGYQQNGFISSYFGPNRREAIERNDDLNDIVESGDFGYGDLLEAAEAESVEEVEEILEGD